MTAQQLKNSILQMAVQGKLVPQDPNDEPASVLLERIQAEKAQMVKDRKIKKEKNPSVIFRGDDNLPYEKVGDNKPACIADEVPFEIPDSWEWARLEDLCEYIQRGKSPKYSPIKKYPVVAQKCNQWSGFSLEKAKFIDPDTLKSYGTERILQNKDLMWNSTGLGTLGRIAIYEEALNPYELAVADSHVTVIRPLKNFIVVDYLYFYFSSPSVQLIIEDLAEGSTKQKELATITIKNYLVPVPPRAEQQRIAEKIETLTPYIDNYNDQYESLEILNNGFLDQLKKSILQQAVQGKLVPQDPTDEPASVLLEKIRAEKEQMIKDGKIKKEKNPSVIFRGDDNLPYEKTENGDPVCIADEVPFEIPDSWEWVRIKNFCIDVFSGKSPKYEKNETGYRVIGQAANQQAGINYASIKYTNASFWEEMPGKYFLQKDDVLLNTLGNGTLGRSGIVTDLPFDLLTDGHLFVFRNFNHISSLYFYYFLQANQEEIIKTANGSTNQTFLSLNSTMEWMIPVPPLSEQCRIVERINNANLIVPNAWSSSIE